MSNNWVVQNIQNALDTWNQKQGEIWWIITQSPKEFRNGAIWNVVSNIHGAIQAIALALLVIFFLTGVIKTCGSFAEVKKPEHAFKLFIRFAISKIIITNGLELLMSIFQIVQGAISTIIKASGLGGAKDFVLPDAIKSAVENCDFFTSIPLWAVTLIGSLVITILSFVMILSVYGRFFKLYLYTAIAPIPLSTFRRRANSTCGEKFYKIFLCGVFRRSNYSVSLCNIFSVCFITAEC